MVITQQPASINLCGNLPDIKITSATPVDIVLSFKGSVILQEAYRPSADDEIIVKLKDLIDDLLNLEVPAFNVAVFNQASAYADITIDVNNGEEEINFRVVKGGVDSVVLDAEEFLSANFLTWQPQQKFVKYTDPEWLTYYASVESVLKVKAYYQASTQTITLATLPAEQLSAVNINYGNITSLLTDQPLYFDAWVEVAGEVKSFVQRYILTTEAFPAEDIFVFANSIGGLDTIRFTGEKEEKNDYKFDSALFDEDTLDFDIEINQVFSKNSGYFRSERNRVWSLEFFKSLQKYHIRSGAISRVVVTKPKLESVGDELAGYTFDFALSRQTQYLNLSRADELPTDLQIIGPNDELFFLAPRLSEFPQANFDDVLFAVQSPYEGRWYKFSLADILNVFQEQDPTVPDYVKLITPKDIANWNAGGGVVGSVYTKSQIDSFFAGGITITGYNKTDWDTAHSWGNHAIAGYATPAYVSANFQPLENQRLSTANSVVFNKIEATDTLFIPTTPPTELIPGKVAIYIGDLSGITDVPGSDYVLPIASASILGGIKIGSGLTISGDGTISVSALGGVTSFNTRTGAISLNSGDVTGALGFTPYNATNPSGYITSGALSGYATESWATGNFASLTGYNKSNWDSAYGWGNHASVGYALANGSNASGTWGINISGNAGSATNWGGTSANFTIPVTTLDYGMGFKDGVASFLFKSDYKTWLNLNDGSTLNNNISGNASSATSWGGLPALFDGTRVANPYAVPAYNSSTSRIEFADGTGLANIIGLGSNAYTSTAYLPLTGGNLTGTTSLKSSNELRFYNGSNNNWSLIRNSSSDTYAVLDFITGVGMALRLNHDMSAVFASSVEAPYLNFPTKTSVHAYELGNDPNIGYYVYDKTLGTYRFVVADNGNILIGYTSDQGYKLSVNGRGFFSDQLTVRSDDSNTRKLALSTYNPAGGNMTAIYMGYASDGNDPYGVRIVQTGNPTSSKNGGFLFQSHNGVTGAGDASYYNLMSLDPSGNAIFANNVNASSFYANNWFRSTGASGWFSQDYGGGIYMEDTSWVRVYNGKGFLVGGTVGIQSPRFMNTTDGFKSYNYRGMVGDYDQNSSSEKIIWTIGDNWNTLANMYGLGYDYNSIAGFGHSLFMANAGNKTIRFSLETGTASFNGDLYSLGINLNTDLRLLSNAGYGIISQDGTRAIAITNSLVVIDSDTTVAGTFIAPTIKATSVLKIPTTAPPSGALQPGEACMYIGDLSGITT